LYFELFGPFLQRFTLKMRSAMCVCCIGMLKNRGVMCSPRQQSLPKKDIGSDSVDLSRGVLPRQYHIPAILVTVDKPLTGNSP
jgi:hypothetical protein